MSNSKYIWNYLDDISNIEISKLSYKLGIHRIVAKMILQRKYISQDINFLMDSNIGNLSSYKIFKDIEIAVDRIEKAINNKEKILIYGDYDADGVCATAVMQKSLQKVCSNVIPYIPNRLTDGYGLSINSIKDIIKQDVDLIITVDNGIRAIKEIAFAKENNVDVIITDHHPPGDILPDAIAILNPHIGENITPYAGCGVAYQLVRALEDRIGSLNSSDLLDIIAIGTFTDIVPLIKDNRIIVKEGLKLISKGKHTGIVALLRNAGRNPENISEYELGYVLGPRLNSAGRKGEANIALELLCLDNDLSASMYYARIIENYNNWRKIEMEKIGKEALSLLKNSEENSYGIVLYKPDWHFGILGLGASKIAETFNRPTILLKKEGDLVKGSGRSPIKDFNLIEILNKCSNYLESYGGHSQAIGISLKLSNYEIFKEKFNFLVKEIFKNNKFPDKQVINITGNFFPVYNDYNLFNDLKKLAPFGLCNEKPNFVAKNVSFEKTRKIGMNHFTGELISKRGKIRSIGYGFADILDSIYGKNVDVVYNLIESRYNEKTFLQASILDINIL